MTDEEGWHDWLEPPALETLMVKSQHHGVVVPVLEWLVRELRSEVGDSLGGVTMCVIAMRRFGTYPVVAFRVDRPERVGPVKAVLEEAADRILRNAKLVDFLRFAEMESRSWGELAADLLGDERG